MHAGAAGADGDPEGFDEPAAVTVVVAVRQQDHPRRPVVGKPLDRVATVLETVGRQQRVDQHAVVAQVIRAHRVADPLVKGTPVKEAGSELAHRRSRP